MLDAGWNIMETSSLAGLEHCGHPVLNRNILQGFMIYPESSDQYPGSCDILHPDGLLT